jgi:hypothetical protein
LYYYYNRTQNRNTIDNEYNGILVIPLWHLERCNIKLNRNYWNRKGSSTLQSTTNITEYLSFHCGIWNDGTIQCNIKWNRKGYSTIQSTTNVTECLSFHWVIRNPKKRVFTKNAQKNTKIKKFATVKKP